jgi:hypothetical protein
MFLMLNPSTATAQADDPTIRRCRDFAKRFGCGGMEIGNVYAYRSTDPKALALVDNPVGEATDDYLLRALATAFPVVLAWGAVIECVPFWANRLEQVVAMVRGALALRPEAERHPHHLGDFTAAGHPRHPLYLPADAPLNRIGAIWAPPA